MTLSCAARPAGLDPLKIVGITTLDVVRANKRRRSEGVGWGERTQEVGGSWG